jgi:hypothetical protein
MEDRNGVIVFNDRDLRDGTHPALQALSSVSFGDVVLPWGFFLKDVDGKKKIVAASREDHYASMRRADPTISEHALQAPCYEADPTDCSKISCAQPGYRCGRYYDEEKSKYGCGCFREKK